MKLSSKILLAFAIVLVLSILDTSSNYLLSLKVEQNIEFLNKSQDIIRNSAKFHKTIIEMQSSFRGYLLTGNPELLDGYKNGITSVPVLFAEEKKLVEDNARHVAILDSINSIFTTWIGYTNKVILAREAKAPAVLTRNTLFEKANEEHVLENIDEDMRHKFRSFDKLEYKKRRTHSANLISSIETAHLFSMTFIVLTILVGIVSAVYIVYNISRRINTMVQLAENISGGHFTRIEDRHHDEMTSLSNSLNIMSDKLNKNITALEKQNVELDTFAYVVSHDLKAPIRGIHNVVKWIEEDLHDELSPQLKEYLAIIPQRVKRMEDLINGLLAYARTREKTMPEQTNVFDLVNEIVETIVPRNIKVEIDHLPTLVTERLKLEQVFTNLISNAVKHVKPEGGIIKISCKKTNAFFEFSVSDNGHGIDKEYHTKIFGMFQTLREKNEEESTGIGLALIKKILDDQHCTIWINSALGNGAEFIFTWPLDN